MGGIVEVIDCQECQSNGLSGMMVSWRVGIVEVIKCQDYESNGMLNVGITEAMECWKCQSKGLSCLSRHWIFCIKEHLTSRIVEGSDDQECQSNGSLVVLV